MSYLLEIRNHEFWSHVPTFVKREFEIPDLGIKVLGYFPYHTAKIIPSSKVTIRLPRELFETLELQLIRYNISDNKAVYICTPLGDFNGACNFAIMFKDSYVIVDSWESVVSYDNHPLKVNSERNETTD